jgi:hypothetical protein
MDMSKSNADLVSGDFHRFTFFDVQITLLPVLGRGYWNWAGVWSVCVCGTAGFVVAEVLHFVQDDKTFREG